MSEYDPRHDAWKYATIFWFCGALFTIPTALTLQLGDYRGAHPEVLWLAGAGPALVTGTLVGLYGRRLPLLVPFSAYAAVPAISVSAWALGPDMQVGLLLFSWVTVYAFSFLRERHHVPIVALIALSYGAVVGVTDGHPAPVLRLAIVVGTAVVVGLAVRLLVQRAAAAADDERRARTEADAARAELAVVNAKLAERVEEQGEEVERLQNLRRFLSPQVADAIVGEAGDGSASMLEPHRREIAVFFADIRGFTAFAADVEPEEVIDLLGSFHDVVGTLVDRYEATVGGFTGDGLFGYFNDPLPCDDPAERAVRLAIDLRDECEDVFRAWRRRGFALGLGVGVAQGYATLGVIGFEGRRDYTALGTVVNLAARLCAEAGPGEVLVDPRAAEAVSGIVSAEETGPMELKGIPRPVNALRVSSAVPESGAAPPG